MKARRVVTGINSEGKSVIVSDGEPPRSVTLESFGGAALIDLWHLPAPQIRFCTSADGTRISYAVSSMWEAPSGEGEG